MDEEKMQMAAKDLANITLKYNERNEEDTSCALNWTKRTEQRKIA